TVVGQQFAQEDQTFTEKLKVMGALQQIHVGICLVSRLEDAFGRVGGVNIDQPDFAMNRGVVCERGQDWKVVSVEKAIRFKLPIMLWPKLKALRDWSQQDFVL